MRKIENISKWEKEISNGEDIYIGGIFEDLKKKILLMFG